MSVTTLAQAIHVAEIFIASVSDLGLTFIIVLSKVYSFKNLLDLSQLPRNIFTMISLYIGYFLSSPWTTVAV